jgi:hypothetical protein
MEERRPTDASTKRPLRVVSNPTIPAVREEE